VKLSAKAEYACLAMLELALQFTSGEPVRIRDISERHEIPARFLVQILLQLKGAGLVVSTRGAAGGYQLQKPPAKIALGDVMSIMEGGAVKFNTARDATPVARVLQKAWQAIDDAQRKMVQSLSFAELADRVRGEAQGMYYI
jgi:Rrf2 family protein